MKMNLIFLISFVLTVYVPKSIDTAKLPSYVTKCNRSSEEFNYCLLQNANNALKELTLNGDPKLKLQNLIDFHVDRFALQQTQNLQVDVANVTFHYRKQEFTDISLEDDILTMTLHIDRLEVIGEYFITGRLLILPIVGNGPFNATFDDFDFEYKIKLDREERKGKMYYKVSNYEDVEHDARNFKRIYFDLQNLFNGDKRLGDQMNKFLNEFWHDVFLELKEPLEQVAVLTVGIPYVNSYFRRTSIDELFD